MSRSDSTGFSLRPGDERPPAANAQRWPLVLAGFLVAVCAGLGYLLYEGSRRARVLEEQMARLEAETREAQVRAREALERSQYAESSAQKAAEGRQAAEAQTATAQGEAETARMDAASAREETASAKQETARAQTETQRLREQVEAEMNRVEEALAKIAETRRTGQGVVMNLGSEHLKFEFDKAELRQEDREMLSRVAGVLLSAHDYTVSVNGHTDDVGSSAYNQKLSERRAQAVRDYLVKAGLSGEILSVTGHGKTLPLVAGTTDTDRARNRRVELAIASTRIQYGRQRP